MIATPYLPDLGPYRGSAADETIGLEPLAVGWLRRGKQFATGPVPATFPARLLAFCRPANRVALFPRPFPCGLENHPVPPVETDGGTLTLGLGEIRVIGEEDIYAAPDLIYHYVVDHGYRPPDLFIEAVLQGPQPGSAEHRALLRALQAS